MILFSISCETCASRLNVRQKAAIGQVLACPKCGSMVQVHPPEGWEAPINPDAPPPRQPKPPADPNDSQATVDTGLADLNPKAQRAAIVRPKSGPAAPRRVRSTLQSQPPSVTPSIQTTTTPNSSKENGPIMPDGQWTSDAVAKRRKALAWISGIFGICLIGIVIGLYGVSKMMGGSEEDPSKNQTQVAQKSGDPKTAKTPDDSNSKVADTKKSEGPKKDDPKKDDPSKDDPEKGETNSTGPPPASNDKEENPDDGGTTTTPEASTSGNPGSEDPGSETPPENQPESSSTNDPPGPDDILNADGALTPPQALDDQKDDDSVLDNLGDLSELMNPGIDVTGYLEAKTDIQSKLIGIGKVYVPVPKKLEFDMQAAANELYPGMMYTDIPLIELCRNLTRLTQVPFQLDHKAIQMGLLDPYAKVSGKTEDGSAIDFLNTAIEPLKLKSAWDESKSVIVVSPKQNSGLQSFEITLQHLKLDDPQKIESVIASIQRIVEPDSWNTNGGVGTISYSDGKIKVEQAGSLATLTESAIRKLDLAAALVEDPNDTDSLQQLASKFARSKDLRETTSNYLNEQNELTQDVLKRLNRDDGVVILMDWVELMQYDWNPNVQIPWNSKDLTFAKTLNDLTSSMNLAYRILDEKTFEITSKRKRDLGTRLEVFPCGKQLANGFNEERILALLQAGLAAEMPPKELAYSWVEYVKESQCIVAVLPEPLLISTEKLLEQMLKSE